MVVLKLWSYLKSDIISFNDGSDKVLWLMFFLINFQMMVANV